MNKTTMLKKNYEFRTVLTRGKCFKEKEIEIFVIKNNKKRNFLGIAISSKSGKAFQRNRAKRIIRECYTKLEENIRCKFYPTCSEYTRQAIEKYGVIKGCILGGVRILKCNPFSKGGYDPLK